LLSLEKKKLEGGRDGHLIAASHTEEELPKNLEPSEIALSTSNR